MSVSKWAYEPEKCDGDFCVGECDLCNKKWEVANAEVHDSTETDNKEEQ